MFKEISVRIVIFLVLIIVACLIYKYLPSSLKNAKVKAILTIATTLLGVLQFIIPSLSNPFFNDNIEESSNESSQSEIVTTAAITTATLPTNKITSSLTTMKTTTTISETTATTTSKNGNTYIDAIPLEIGESCEKSVIYSDDNDNCVWYIVNISEDGLLSLNLNTSVGVYFYINLICINGNDSINYDRGQDRILTINTPVQAGEYYIKISYEQSGTYSLNSRLSTSDYSNDVEVNSPYQNAKLIESNILNGHIGYRGNLPNETDTDDFYKLTLDSFRLFTFNLTMDSDLKTKLFLIASDGATEIYSDYGKNKEITLICPLQPGTYYIRIVCLENYGGYQLQINSDEIKSLDNEPNNTYQKSVKITSDETIIGSIGFVNDKNEYDQYDWYTFNTNERSHITIKTSSQNPFQYEINLIGTDGEQSLSYSKCHGEIETIEYDLEPSKYYIRVFSYNYGEYDFSYSLNSDFGDD